MAWNEPGGDSNKQSGKSWGPSRGKGQPPDLDEILFHIFKPFKKSVSGHSSSALGTGLFLMLLAVLYIGSGFFVVKPAERAVILRFGAFNREVSQGLHWIPSLIESKKIINSERIYSTQRQGSMLTCDENIVYVGIEVQYRVNHITNYLFNMTDPISTLKEAADSALRQVVGHSKLDYVITYGKEEIAHQIKEQMQSSLQYYRSGMTVVTVAMKEAKVPDQVKAAFDDVIQAREKREQLKHQAEAYANKILPEARGHAERLLQYADAYRQEVVLTAKGDVISYLKILPEYKKAPDVTRARIYMSTIENVLNNSTKIFIDDRGKNQSLFYLSLDKLQNNYKLPKQDNNTQKIKTSIKNDTNKKKEDDIIRLRRRSS